MYAECGLHTQLGMKMDEWAYYLPGNYPEKLFCDGAFKIKDKIGLNLWTWFISSDKWYLQMDKTTEHALECLLCTHSYKKMCCIKN